jgi:hypothetical protein
MSARVFVPLSQIAHGRSGDKGDHANVAIIAYTETGYEWLKRHLTADKVASHFAGLNPTQVQRYEAPNVRGFNFMLHHALAGGASRSLRSDTQGKSYAMALLQMPIEVPADHADMLRTGS